MPRQQFELFIFAFFVVIYLTKEVARKGKAVPNCQLSACNQWLFTSARLQWRRHVCTGYVIIRVTPSHLCPRTDPEHGPSSKCPFPVTFVYCLWHKVHFQSLTHRVSNTKIPQTWFSWKFSVLCTGVLIPMCPIFHSVILLILEWPSSWRNNYASIIQPVGLKSCFCVNFCWQFNSPCWLKCKKMFSTSYFLKYIWNEKVRTEE